MDTDNRKQGMEDGNKCEHCHGGGGCGCGCGQCGAGGFGGGMCSCGRFGGHRVLRVLLGLIILGIVFAMGLKLGEVKGMYNSAFYGGSMRGGRFMMMRGAPGMMNGGVNQAPMMPVTTSTP
jgi:hypothetical protein